MTGLARAGDGLAGLADGALGDAAGAAGVCLGLARGLWREGRKIMRTDMGSQIPDLLDGAALLGSDLARLADRLRDRLGLFGLKMRALGDAAGAAARFLSKEKSVRIKQ